MNPHFTFNVLAAVQHFICGNQLDEASEYLAKFGQLIRKNLEMTTLKSISLREERDFINEYLILEKQRRPELLDYQLTTDQDVDQDSISIQAILIQPLVENSIKHGFKSIQSGGRIEIIPI